MTKVVIQIVYKSGKVELAEINRIKYGQVRVGLLARGDVETVQIVT
jgi:hypothetical protein